MVNLQEFIFDGNYACDNIYVIEDLLDNGLDLNIRNNYGSSILHYTKSSQVTKKLLDLGLDPNIRNNYMETPLHYTNNIKKLELLIEAGADINAIDIDGNSPLHNIVLLDSYILKEFLEYHPITNIKNKMKVTPFEIALSIQNIENSKIIKSYELNKILTLNEVIL